MVSGHVHFDDLENDSLRLLTLVTGMPEAFGLVDEWTDESTKPLKVIVDPLIGSLLISLAVRYRMVEDRFVDKTRIKYPFPSDEVCSFKLGNPTRGDGQKSGLRLASDKIIHAEFVAPVGAHNEEWDWSRLLCRGRLGINEWSVLIDVKKFAVSGICLAQQYEEDWIASGRQIVMVESGIELEDNDLEA